MKTVTPTFIYPSPLMFSVFHFKLFFLRLQVILFLFSFSLHITFPSFVPLKYFYLSLLVPSLALYPHALLYPCSTACTGSGAMPKETSLRQYEQRCSEKWVESSGVTPIQQTNRAGLRWVCMIQRRQIDMIRCLCIGEERALNGRKVYLVQETNEAGVSSEALMPNPSMGIESVFSAFLGCFLVLVTSPEMK